YSGVLKKDTPDADELATEPTTELRIARNDNTKMRPSTVSIMPAGLEQHLDKQGLADLLAFLKSTKSEPLRLDKGMVPNTNHRTNLQARKTHCADDIVNPRSADRCQFPN